MNKDTNDQNSFTPKNKKSFHRQIAEIWRSKNSEISSDVLGSYTGTPKDDERPDQDADDL
ncbi:MAG: hypothetical protein LBH71_01645 [Oscillospiraceae bacterium]|jgi:Sec7-like guanine-nucleotide exchange factor|nr:hypothetical protein [Oscillospiraceae bacterium]